MEGLAAYASSNSSSSSNEDSSPRAHHAAPTAFTHQTPSPDVNASSEPGRQASKRLTHSPTSRRPCKRRRGTQISSDASAAAGGAHEMGQGLQEAASTQQTDWQAPALVPPPALAAPWVDPTTGRQHRYGRIQGQYPLIVYIPVTALDPGQLAALRDTFHALAALLPGLQPIVPQLQLAESNLTPPTADDSTGVLGLHLSLSRVQPVRWAVLETLLGSLKDELQPCARFRLTLSGLQAFENDDRSRTFVCLAVTAGRERVCRMTRYVNRAMRVYDLQTYYEDPKPHVSFAWLLGPQLERAVAVAQGLERVNRPAELQMDVDRVICRSGNKEHVVWQAAEA